MRNNAYLKIILTVIAVEILVLIFKINPSEKIYFSNDEREPKAVHAGYNTTRAIAEREQQVMNVNIVGVGGKEVSQIPVVVRNPLDTKNNKAFPLVVKLEK